MATVTTTEMTPDDEQLLDLQEFVENFSTKGFYEPQHDENEDCTICREPLFARNEQDEKRPCVKMQACAHLFHVDCILRNLRGTYPTRTLCPNCRKPICKLGILSPKQVAGFEAEDEHTYWHGESDWNAELYTKMMLMTDEFVQMEQTLPPGQEDWVGLITYIRRHWIFQVSDSVWRAELTSDSEDDTGDDQQGSHCGSPPRHDTAGTCTVEMDEAMHDADTSNESLGSQPHEDLENETNADSEIPRTSDGEYDGNDDQQLSHTASLSRHDTLEKSTAAADKDERMQDSNTSNNSPESQSPADPTSLSGNEWPSQGSEH